MGVEDGVMGRRTKQAAAVLVLAGSLSVAFASAEAQDAVFITVTNNSLQDARIAVADGLCGGMLFRGLVLANTTITVNPCANSEGNADLVVEDLATGAVNRYDDISSGTDITLR